MSRSSSPSQFSFSSLEYSLKSQPSFHSPKVLLIALESSIYMFQSLRVKKGKFSRNWPSKRIFFRIVAPWRCVPSAAALDGKIRGRQNAVMGAKTLVILPVHNFCRISALRRCKLAPKRHPFCPNVLFRHISAPKRYEWAPKRYVCCLFHHKLSKTFQIIDFHLSFKQRTKTHKN